ncbi:rho GTPase-activating protein 28 [Cyprinodon tularosa]|uniref:rho GTPase-activating protein 28 n=1 Tax=Cyprinodon tularosa TaxID=77115 RepID=UPI0018E1F724|nr:rho GTPase-activating protein 28 [Cyprinodon tularosa]
MSSRTERRMLSSHSATFVSTSSSHPPPHPVTSDSRKVTMETYWREVQSIEEEQEGEEEEEEEEESKSLDEVELEEAWLTEAGLSSLLVDSASTEAPPVAEAVLSTLTRQQAATVKKRLDNYNETLRKRNRQPIRDVRDVFTEPDGDAAVHCSPFPTQRHPESPPRRYHTTTKTIRRSTNRGRSTLPLSTFEDQLPEDPSSPALTPSPSTPSTFPSEAGRLRCADWLLRDTPYSEGVAEHKQGGTCKDCACFHGDENSELQFAPVSPSYGLTCSDDLSTRDLTRLGFISRIELSTFLAAMGVQIKRTRPPHRRTRDSGVFGVSLNSLLDNDRKTFPGVKVPVFFQKLLGVLEQSALQTEGILRVPGSAAKLKYLRRELDRCWSIFDWSEVRPVDASGLLKLFIRELPTPLLTNAHLSTFCSLLAVSSEVHQVQALQLLLLLLPEAHRNTLKALLVFLRKVVSHQDHNRMSLWNVSMVMAPNIFTRRNRGNKRSISKQRGEMEEAVGGAHLIGLMIRHQDLLWTVPKFLLSQVRQMNQASNHRQFNLSRATSRLLRRRNEKNDRNQVGELCEGVIRVHAPLHAKVSMAIQLDEQTTAKDVTSRFESRTSPAQHLYEVGGNICKYDDITRPWACGAAENLSSVCLTDERRLQPDCCLLDVYRENPCCDWLIKP